MILGLDLALACSGIALWDPKLDLALDYTTIITKPKDELGVRLNIIADAVADYYHAALYDIDGVFVEQPIHNRMHSPTTTLRLGMVHGAIRRSLRDLSLIEVNPTTVKRLATGAGKADKASMVAAAKRRWGIVCKPDEADALFVAVAGYSR